jgi:hypothetical protein
VLIELKLGSYPFQKFRMTPKRFSVRPKNNTENDVSFEPRFCLRSVEFILKYRELKRKLLEFVMLPSIGSRSREEIV